MTGTTVYACDTCQPKPPNSALGKPCRVAGFSTTWDKAEPRSGSWATVKKRLEGAHRAASAAALRRPEGSECGD